MKKLLGFLLLTFFLIIVGLGAAAYFLKMPHEFWDNLIPMPEGELRTVVIRPGFNARQSAQAFYDQGALSGSPTHLAWWMARMEIDRTIRPGEYRVVKTDPWNMARQLITARPISARLTIIPGMDIISIRDLFNAENNPYTPGIGDQLSKSLMNDQNYPEPMRRFLPATERSRIAFLLPETYFVTDESPDTLVQVASLHWWNRFRDRLPENVTPRYLEERAIIAAMIQREAQWDSEGPAIAGVIENRLRRNMLLQIDATVVYSWRLRGEHLTRVFFRHLTIDCPYNTYVHRGLPPAPICIPSAASWESALAPEDNNYYFYVANRLGYHYFSTTYDEHRRNIRRARAE